MDLRDNGHLSPAPPPSGAVVDTIAPMDQERYEGILFNEGHDAAEKYLVAIASSPSEPTVDEQTEKIMDAINPLVIWYSAGLGPNAESGKQECRNRIKDILSR